jgi:hypothetical protein
MPGHEMSALLIIAAFAAGYLIRDQQWRFWPERGAGQIIIDRQGSTGPMSVQINLNGRPMAWVALTPNVRSYIERRLAEV